MNRWMEWKTGGAPEGALQPGVFLMLLWISSALDISVRFPLARFALACQREEERALRSMDWRAHA